MDVANEQLDYRPPPLEYVFATTDTAAAATNTVITNQEQQQPQHHQQQANGGLSLIQQQEQELTNWSNGSSRQSNSNSNSSARVSALMILRRDSTAGGGYCDDGGGDHKINIKNTANNNEQQPAAQAQSSSTTGVGVTKRRSSVSGRRRGLGLTYSHRREISASLLDNSAHHSWANLSGYDSGCCTSRKEITTGSNSSVRSYLSSRSNHHQQPQCQQKQQQHMQQMQRHWSDAGAYDHGYDQGRYNSNAYGHTRDDRNMNLKMNDSLLHQHWSSTEQPWKMKSRNGYGNEGKLPRRNSSQSDPGKVSSAMSKLRLQGLTRTHTNTDTTAISTAQASSVHNSMASSTKPTQTCLSKSVLIPQFTSQRRTPSVTFSTIEIRQYERILGDNPSCSTGPSISIGWSYDPHRTTLQPLDEYEYRRPKRHDGTEMVLTRAERECLLLHLGYTRKELTVAVRSNVKLKKKRRQTLNNLPISSVEEIWEGASKKVARMMRKRPGSKYLYDQWVNKCESDCDCVDSGITELSPSRSTGSTLLRSSLKRSSSSNHNQMTVNTTTDGCSDFVSTSYLSQHERGDFSSDSTTGNNCNNFSNPKSLSASVASGCGYDHDKEGGGSADAGEGDNEDEEKQKQWQQQQGDDQGHSKLKVCDERSKYEEGFTSSAEVVGIIPPKLDQGQ